MLSLGIVGLPNVGKSLLFNLLTKSHAAKTENFPFCTIDPNVGIVEVRDKKLAVLADIVKTKVIKYATFEFVDIAGIVKGASAGEGLGNKFLANIRETDAIVVVLRCFEDDDVIHVNGRIDPKEDMEVILLELVLADQESLDKQIQNLEKKMKNDKEAKAKYDVGMKIKTYLDKGQLAREVTLSPEETVIAKEFHLLTGKKIMYVMNLSEPQAKALDVSYKISHDQVYNPSKFLLDFSRYDKNNLNPFFEDNKEAAVLPINLKYEEQLVDFTEEEAAEFLKEIGQTESGLDRLVKTGFDLLGLMTYFTAGEIEARAWTITKNTTAPRAAGVIHTDFEKKFIKAEVSSYNDFVENSGWGGVKEKGKLRLEGKEYIVHNGDVMNFKIGE
jgi:hypothetical protein